MPMKRLLIVLPLAFLAIFFFYPLASITARGLAPAGVIDLSAFGKIIGSEFYRETLWFTFWQAAVSTGLTLLAAFPAAYVMARYTFRGKSLISALTLVPFVMPTVIVAAGFMALIGPRGWINAALKTLLNVDYAPLDIQNTIWIILLAHVFYNFAVALRLISSFWANLDPQVTQAARVLGANRWRAFREVTLPLLRPAIFAAALLVFIFDFTSFGVILILGGPQFDTIETAIYRKTLINFDLPTATALALVQLACTFALIVIYTRLQNRAGVPLDLRPRQITQQRPATQRAKALLLSVTIALLSLLLLPLGALFVRSFVVNNTLSFDNYLNLATNPRGSVLFVPPLTALGNSLLFAGITTLIALIVGTVAAYVAAGKGRLSRWSEPIWALPLGASAVTLGFGFLIGFPALRSAWIMIPLAHSLVAFPFVVRTITPALRSIRSNLREAAAVMGADPSRVWREVDLPILGRALLIGGAFAFAVSLGEFGATAMLARAEMPTLPYAIFRYLSQPGSLNYGQAMAMSTVLMLVVAISLVAIDRFRIGEIGEF
ncbi:Putative 2-aminoethylphosphonate transport system permease protein PhnU [Thermoflexales bacterium]|nr:Putative 2-aminoethylphosphonate transport system permease protein PhnU [Thermoflexales bacterium]